MRGVIEKPTAAAAATLRCYFATATTLQLAAQRSILYDVTENTAMSIYRGLVMLKRRETGLGFSRLESRFREF